VMALWLSILVIGLGAGGGAVFYFVTRPSLPERTARGRASELHELEVTLNALDAELSQTSEAKTDQLKNYQRYVQRASDICRQVIIEKPDAKTYAALPEGLKSLQKQMEAFCPDVFDVTLYGDKLMHGAEAFITQKVNTRWDEPGAPGSKAPDEAANLAHAADISYRLLKGYLDDPQIDIKYPGAPEILIVLKTNYDTWSSIADRLGKNESVDGSSEWFPALATYDKNQQDILNQRITYWHEYVQISGMQQSIKRLRTEYCKQVHKRGFAACQPI
jgi:hypothetical protein